MRIDTPQITWHGGDDGKNNPLFGLDSVQTCGLSPTIIATCGNDSSIHLWRVLSSDDGDNNVSGDGNNGGQDGAASGGNSPVEHVVNLSKHEGGVNCVRFSPDGLSLVTAGDRGSCIVWSVPMSKRGGGNGRHFWNLVKQESDLQCKILRSQCEDVFSCSWSPCSRRFILGSLDHKITAFEDQSVSSEWGGSGDWKLVWTGNEHKHYVQGVSYDPLGVYVATQGSDRSVHVLERKQPPKRSSKKVDKKVAVLAESTKDNSEATSGRSSPVVAGGAVGASENSIATTTTTTTTTATATTTTTADKDGGDSAAVENTTTTIASTSTPSNQLNEIKFELLKSKQIKFRLFKEDKVEVLKSDVVDEKEAEKKQVKRHNMYVDETMQSFFRRLEWTVDGAFLITPSGLWQADETDAPKFCSYVFARHQFDKPVAVLECGDKPSVVVRACPFKYELPKGAKKKEELSSLFKLMPENCDYRCLFAVLTRDSVYIYDTYHTKPLAIMKGLHYAGLTDATWTGDGKKLLVSSSDGYVSLLSFEEGELGEIIVEESLEVAMPVVKEVAAVPSTVPVVPPLPPNQTAVSQPPTKKLRSEAHDTTVTASPNKSGVKRRIAPVQVSTVGETADRSLTPTAAVETLNISQDENNTLKPNNSNNIGNVPVVNELKAKPKKKRIQPQLLQQK